MNHEETIFEQALGIGSLAAQEEFLRRACAGNQAMLERLQGLLRAHDRAGKFLEHDRPADGETLGVSPSGGAAPRPAEAGTPNLFTEKPGDRIGRYKLLQKIGEGGCGVVYMAEQEEPVRRRVALKIIKLGMDTRQVIARFEAERQALAMMDHPNIAKVFDAGSTERPLAPSLSPAGGEGDRRAGEGSANPQPSTLNPQLSPGRPYFVMELVRGVKITEYSDEKKLTTQQRLELFTQVCRAVQHAHQKGIIHRDLKPSNILVSFNDGVAVPKVIDFGIAKATSGEPLTDKTVFTAFEQFIGTPAYMSPEQALVTSLDIDTRTDIYSLGVLLYELLTGQTPFDPKELLKAGLDEMRRTIREEEPQRPSTRLSTLPGEALSTTAQRRGLDVPKLLNQLRGDLDWIVMKCLEKDRARRYETANDLAADVQRHLSNEPVVASPPGGLYRFRKMVRRNKGAVAAASAVAAALVLGLGLSTWLLLKERAARQRAIAAEKSAQLAAGMSRQVTEFLKKTLQGVGPSVALGRDTQLLQEILDRTVQQIGTDLAYQPEVEVELRNTLGQVYLALGKFELAETMHRAALATAQIQGKETLEIAASLDGLAAALWRQAKLEEAERLQRQALDLRRRLQGGDHPDLVPPLTTLAQLLTDKGRLKEAEEHQRRVVDLCQGQSADARRRLMEALKALASILYQQKQLEQAEALDRQALELEIQLLDKRDPEIAMTLNDLATILHLQGKFAEAEVYFSNAVSRLEGVLDSSHPARLRLLANLATCLSEQGKLPEAEANQREVLSAQRRALGHKNLQVAETLCNLGRTLQAQAKLTEAETNELEALAMRRELLGNMNVFVGVSLNHLTGILKDAHRLPEAEAYAREALALYRTEVGPEHRDYAGSLLNLASVLFEAGKLLEAEVKTREAQALYEKLLPDDWRTYNTRCQLGATFLRERNHAEAERLLVEGFQGLMARQEKIPFINKTCIKKAGGWLVELYQALGKPDQVAEWREKLEVLGTPAPSKASDTPGKQP